MLGGELELDQIVRFPEINNVAQELVIQLLQGYQ